MQNINYSPLVTSNINTLPKIDNALALGIYDKIVSKPKVAIVLTEDNRGYYFHNAPIHWVRAFDFAPYFKSDRDGELLSSHYKSFFAQTPPKTKALLAILNSSLFYFWFIINSNSRDLSVREIGNFGLDFNDNYSTDLLAKLGTKLIKFYKKISQQVTTYYRATGNVTYEQIDTKKGKHIIDEIDEILANHYNFSKEQLDYILNYDIKFRLGKDLKDVDNE
jgi:hypothetical protein